jgi:hypothetical protein
LDSQTAGWRAVSRAVAWGDWRAVHWAAESDVSLADLWAAERADSWDVE